MSKTLARKQLRAYQSRLVRLLGEALAGGDRKIALISPTGSGKSLMVTTTLARLRDAEVFRRAVVCVPQSHIKDSFRFSGLVLDVGDEFTPRRLPIVTDVRDLAEVDAAGRVTANFVEHLAGRGDRFAYVCTHAALTRAEATGAVKATELSGVLLVIDEGHHSTGDKHANQLSRLRDTWLAAGGSVLLATATPYRTDSAPVIDDEWVRVSRSIADQCADGFAPERLECRHRSVSAKAKTRKEFEDGGKMSAIFVKAIVQDWAEVDQNASGDRPKAIVIVPQTDSRRWTKMLAREFSKRGARVFDATGTSDGKKAEVRDVLEREGRVECWEDSQIDVMIGCKRFDEGTDWPLCSHVYVIGYPVSIGTTVQRWGRATRSKAGIDGHRFPDVASITFYVHAWSKELAADYKKAKGGLSLHRETSHLIAAHLHDWETSQQYAKAYKGIWDAARRGPRKHREKAERIEQAVTMTEAETAMVHRDIDEARAKLNLDPSAPLRGDDLRRVVNAVAKHHGDDRANAVAQVLVERSSSDAGMRDRAVGGHVRDVKIAGQAQSLVRREMRARFRAIVESIDLEYHDPAAGSRLADVAQWNGERIRELTERMRTDSLWGEAYEQWLAAEAAAYVQQYGKRPPSNDWGEHDARLRRGLKGVAKRPGGLPEFLDQKAIGKPFMLGPMTSEEIDAVEKLLSAGSSVKACARTMGTSEQRILKGFRKRHGITVREWLRRQLESRIREAIRSHVAKTGKAPTKANLASLYNSSRKAGLSFTKIRQEETGASAESLRTRAIRVREKSRRALAEESTLSWWMACAGLTGAELAARTGVSEASIRNYENGRAVPSSTASDRIAKSLGIEPHQIKWRERV